MQLTKSEIKAIIKSTLHKTSNRLLDDAAQDIFSFYLKNNFSIPSLPPSASESLAISMSNPKIAALSYDRILFSPHIMSHEVNSDIFFHCGTKNERVNIVLYLTGNKIDRELLFQPPLTSYKNQMTGLDYPDFIRTIYRDIYSAYGHSPTLLFDSTETFQTEFSSGPQAILATALNNIAMVDEATLTWEQVLEFRKDTEARAKYKRLVRWIDEELKSKSPEAVQDLIAIRLDDYEWSVKKHGMKTKLGALSCVLDPKFLVAVSAVIGASTLAGGELWAALSAATVTIGGAVVSFGMSYIDSLDERRKDNYEVAYIHDIKKKTT